MLSSNNFINTIGKYSIGLVYFAGFFYVIREILITCLLQTTDQRKLTWVFKAQDMSLTENSNKAFLPGVGEHDSFLYAIS